MSYLFSSEVCIITGSYRHGNMYEVRPFITVKLKEWSCCSCVLFWGELKLFLHALQPIQFTFVFICFVKVGKMLVGFQPHS